MSNSVSSVGVMTPRTISETDPIEQWLDSCPRIDIYKKSNIHIVEVEPTVVIAVPKRHHDSLRSIILAVRKKG